MKKRRIIRRGRFRIGELYVFNATDCTCPADGSLFGIFDKETSDGIYLESSSRDLIHFCLRHRLPNDYRYCRLASRAELRDYIFNLAYYECGQARIEPQV